MREAREFPEREATDETRLLRMLTGPTLSSTHIEWASRRAVLCASLPSLGGRASRLRLGPAQPILPARLCFLGKRQQGPRLRSSGNPRTCEITCSSLNFKALMLAIMTPFFSSRKYGNMGSCMKTTVELPEDLLLEAKRKALETRTTLRDILERALRRELRQSASRRTRRRPRIRWITSAGGLPPGLDVSDRSQMWDWILKERAHDRH